MKRLLRILAVIAVVLGVLYMCGYNLTSIKHSWEIQAPEKVFSPLKEAIPSAVQNLGTPNNNNTDPTIATGTDDVNWTIPTNNDPLFNPSKNTDETISIATSEQNGESGNGGSGSIGASNEINITNKNGGTGETEKLDVTLSRDITVNINGKEVNLKTQTSISFVKWLANNYKDGSDISYYDKDGNPIGETKTTTTETVEATTETSETTETSVTETTKETPSVNPKLIDDVQVSYDDQLSDYAHLVVLIADIEVVDELPDYNTLPKYNRDTFEKPVKSYILGGLKINRNNYSWRTSPFFNQKDFTFTCPYTGKVITDTDDKKQDNDFGTLDYDHIVPLKSAYIRGASEWSKDKQNEYAYDQWVVVDVLNSANRSKADKGPLEYLPEKNIEDYCYSWLLICSKYDLKMTQAEIDLCKKYIENALNSGEPVTHLGGHYDG